MVCQVGLLALRDANIQGIVRKMLVVLWKTLVDKLVKSRRVPYRGGELRLSGDKIHLKVNLVLMFLNCSELCSN